MLFVLVLIVFWISPWREQLSSAPYRVEHYEKNQRIETEYFEQLSEAKKRLRPNGQSLLFNRKDELLDFTGPSIAIAPSGQLTYLYHEPALTKRLSYVAAGTRLSVLERKSDVLRVRVSGADAFVSASGMQLVPEALVKKRHAYVAEDGELYHHVIADGNLNGRFLVGPMPQATDKTWYTDRIEDVYDAPYQFGPIDSKTSYSAKDLDRFLRQLDDSPLRGKGKAFKRAEREHGVNALFLLAVAGHESDYGRSNIARDKNNLFGFNATDTDPSGQATKFESVDASIDAAANLFATKYVRGPYARGPFPGDKAKGVNVYYASDPYWGEKVGGTMYTIDRQLGLKQLERFRRSSP